MNVRAVVRDRPEGHCLFPVVLAIVQALGRTIEMVPMQELRQSVYYL